MPAVDELNSAAADEDPVLVAERAHLARALESLGLMQVTAGTLSDAGGDAFASEMLGRSKANRLKSLADDGKTPPFFGRTDRLRDDDDSAPGLEQFHIGRRHIRDDAGDPVVIDWRAPMSRPFSQATAAQPQGVALRRRFGFAGGVLTSYEDEALITASRTGADVDTEAPLAHLVVAEIERPRAGPMRDIVATIAPDQDDIVRAPLETSLCIQRVTGDREDRGRAAPRRLLAPHLSRPATSFRRPGDRAERSLPALHRRRAAGPRRTRRHPEHRR